MIKKNNSTRYSQGTLLLLFVISAGILLSLIVPQVVKYRLYVDHSFYLAILIILAWLGLIFAIISLSKRFLRDEKRDLMNIFAAILLVMGLPGSMLVGDITCRRGAIFIPVYILFILVVIQLYSVWLAFRSKINHPIEKR